MLLAFSFLMAAMLPLSSTNQVATNQVVLPTPKPSPTPHKKHKPRMLALAAAHIAAIIDEDEDQLIDEVLDNKANQQITPYNAMPAMPHTIKELKYASGNWFGPRDWLAQHGIGFSATYTGLFIGNPVGGKHPGGSAYVDNIALVSMTETEKLFGWHGGYFVMSAVQQDGGPSHNLSTKCIGNLFTVNGAVGGTTMKWVYLYYQQEFWKDRKNQDRMNLILGRVCAMDEFDVSPILWNYVGKFQAAPTNLKKTSNPNASWGSRLKVKVTHDTDLRVGVYQITQASLNGLNWNFYPNDSVSLFAQYSWNPEFCELGSTSLFDHEKKSTPTPSSKEVSSDKSFKDPVDISQLKKLPGHYFTGAFYSTSGTLQFATKPSSVPEAYGFYWHADQMVYRPNPLTNAGLTLWTQLGYSPQDSISVLTFQAKGGAIYTGLIPGRSNDFTIFGVAYGSFSPAWASYCKSKPSGDPTYGDPTYEDLVELGYRINFTRFFYIQPDMQWIINPAGLGSIPNALVLGAQVGIVF